MKGGFGGGFAIIGIPLLALVMDPLTAGALLAPLFVAMDLFALRYWRPKTWSKPDLTLLLPGLVAGIALGTADHRSRSIFSVSVCQRRSMLARRAFSLRSAISSSSFPGCW